MTAPTARAVRGALHRTRRARRAAARAPGERDLYSTVLTTLVLGGVAVQALRSVADVVAPRPESATGPLALAVAVLVAGLALRGAAALGPVLAGPAVRHWLLAAPVDRGALLAPRLAALAGATAAAGAGIGALASEVLAVLSGWWAVTGAAAGAGLAAVAVLAQAGAPSAPRVVPSAVVTVGVLGTAAALFAPVSVPDGPPAPLVGATAVVVAAVLVVVARHRLGRLDRVRLGAGAGLSTGVQAAGVFMDTSLLLGVLEDRRWARFGTHRTRAGSGSGLLALLHADLRRTLRTPGAGPLALLLLLVPHVGAQVLPAPIAAAAAALAACAVAGRVGSGLRLVARSAALRRALPAPDRMLLAVHLPAPLLAAVLWTLAALPALVPLSPLAVLALPVGATAVVAAAALRPPPDYGGELFETGFGAVPLALVSQLVRGPALLAAVAGVQLLLA